MFDIESEVRFDFTDEVEIDMPKAEQQEFEGMVPEEIKELRKTMKQYVKARDAFLKAKDVLIDRRTDLHEKLKEHKLEAFENEGQMAYIVKAEEKVKVKKVKASDD